MGKVWGIGLGKTGTTSLCAALRILGYNAIHQMHERRTLIRELRFVDAATDGLVAVSFREIDRFFPGSKFIYTTREIGAWLESWMGQEDRFQSLTDEKAIATIKRFRTEIFGQWQFDLDVWAAKYESHDAEVREYFKGRQDLLILNLSEGGNWEKICGFLDLPIPPVEFPVENVGGN